MTSESCHKLKDLKSQIFIDILKSLILFIIILVNIKSWIVGGYT